MLLKFAYQDFLADRKFKNTMKVNIGNYERTLGLFIEYCIELGVFNIEDVRKSHVRDYLIDCQERGTGATGATCATGATGPPTLITTVCVINTFQQPINGGNANLITFNHPPITLTTYATIELTGFC